MVLSPEVPALERVIRRQARSLGRDRHGLDDLAALLRIRDGLILARVLKQHAPTNGASS